MYPAIKRILGFLCAGAGLVLLSPLLITLALLVKLTSKGPVFFRQKRVGKNRTHFEILKFRSMYADTPVSYTHLSPPYGDDMAHPPCKGAERYSSASFFAGGGKGAASVFFTSRARPLPLFCRRSTGEGRAQRSRSICKYPQKWNCRRKMAHKCRGKSCPGIESDRPKGRYYQKLKDGPRKRSRKERASRPVIFSPSSLPSLHGAAPGKAACLGRGAGGRPPPASLKKREEWDTCLLYTSRCV